MAEGRRHSLQKKTLVGKQQMARDLVVIP